MQPHGLVFLSGDVHHGEVAHPFQALAQARDPKREESLNCIRKDKKNEIISEFS